MAITRESLVAFMQGHRYAAQSSVHSDGSPQAAIVGVAISDRFEVVFDTLGTSRKAQNLRRFHRIALVIGGFDAAADRTVQLEGIADEPVHGERERLVDLYLDVFPDGRQRQDWPHLTYFRVTPLWLRYANYSLDPPEITEFDSSALRSLK